MEERLLGTFVDAFIKELFENSKELISEFGAEAKQLLNRGLKRYLIKQKDRYSYLKTLLRGNTPVYLYDIYYPLKIQSEGTIIDTSNIFSKTNCITLIGDAGSGKSTLVKHLFLNSIYTKAGIPILIELRYINEIAESLESYIEDKIFENKLVENNRILNRLLENGKFIFFLDGFDELTKENKQKIISNISSFVNQYDQNKFILTSRPYSDVEHLPLFHNHFIKGLDYANREIQGFIHKQLYQEKELAERIVKSIDLDQSMYIKSFLANPLLLTLYILTFQSNASVPNRKYIFYRRVINALFSEHDSKTKLGFVREKKSGLNQEQFEDILKTFCFLSYFETKYVWDHEYLMTKIQLIKTKQNKAFNTSDFIDDLKSAIALWVDDNGQISFAHRSLQEYFAALFVKNLSPKENVRIYEKMIDKFSVDTTGETENFLSLCEEMDTINFYQFYFLPILKDLRMKISGDTLMEKCISFLKFFASGVNIRNGTSHFTGRVEINDFVYKSIYIHLPFTMKLFRELSAISDNDKIESFDGMESKEVGQISNQGKVIVRHISFVNEIPTGFLNLCHGKIESIAQEFDAFLNKKIKETEEYINTSFSQDKDLVDLI